MVIRDINFETDLWNVNGTDRPVTEYVGYAIYVFTGTDIHIENCTTYNLPLIYCLPDINGDRQRRIDIRNCKTVNQVGSNVACSDMNVVASSFLYRATSGVTLGFFNRREAFCNEIGVTATVGSEPTWLISPVSYMPNVTGGNEWEPYTNNPLYREQGSPVSGVRLTENLFQGTRYVGIQIVGNDLRLGNGITGGLTAQANDIIISGNRFDQTVDATLQIGLGPTAARRRDRFSNQTLNLDACKNIIYTENSHSDVEQGPAIYQGLNVNISDNSFRNFYNQAAVLNGSMVKAWVPRVNYTSGASIVGYQIGPPFIGNLQIANNTFAKTYGRGATGRAWGNAIDIRYVGRGDESFNDVTNYLVIANNTVGSATAGIYVEGSPYIQAYDNYFHDCNRNTYFIESAYSRDHHSAVLSAATTGTQATVNIKAPFMDRDITTASISSDYTGTISTGLIYDGYTSHFQFLPVDGKAGYVVPTNGFPQAVYLHIDQPCGNDWGYSRFSMGNGVSNAESVGYNYYNSAYEYRELCGTATSVSLQGSSGTSVTLDLNSRRYQVGMGVNVMSSAFPTTTNVTGTVTGYSTRPNYSSRITVSITSATGVSAGFFTSFYIDRFTNSRDFTSANTLVSKITSSSFPVTGRTTSISSMGFTACKYEQLGNNLQGIASPNNAWSGVYVVRSTTAFDDFSYWINAVGSDPGVYGSRSNSPYVSTTRGNLLYAVGGNAWATGNTGGAVVTVPGTAKAAIWSPYAFTDSVTRAVGANDYTRLWMTNNPFYASSFNNSQYILSGGAAEYGDGGGNNGVVHELYWPGWGTYMTGFGSTAVFAWRMD